jgi:hypothetical protein
MKRIALLAAITACICGSGFATPVSLGTADIENHNNGLSDTAAITGGGFNGQEVYSGLYSWTNNGGTGLGTFVPNFGFCIELPQETANGMTDVIALDQAPQPPLYGSPMGITKANAIRELWGRFFNPNWVTDAATNTVDRQQAGAFGVAVWEIVYETDSKWDVTSGSGFSATGVADAALANQWLSQLTGNSSYFAPNLVAISRTDGQDFLVQVPEPATVAVLGLGSLLFVRKQ